MSARAALIFVVAILFSMFSDDAWNESETNDTRLGMEWTRDKTLELLREYQQRRVLWDWNARGYRDRAKRKRAIQELAEILCCNTLEIEKKITNLKCQYSREVHKIQNSRDTAAGPDDVYVSKWFAFKAMQFLQFGTRRYSKRKKVGIHTYICTCTYTELHIVLYHCVCISQVRRRARNPVATDILFPRVAITLTKYNYRRVFYSRSRHVFNPFKSFKK